MQRSVSRALHDDHMAAVALLERLEALLGRHRATDSPDATGADVAPLLKELRRAIETEIVPHFAFEEECLFPRFPDAGDNEMEAVLVAEHRIILPLAKHLAELATRAREAGFKGDLWADFHTTGAELIERLNAHILKEEMGLLPALDDLLDDDMDGALAIEFAARR